MKRTIIVFGLCSLFALNGSDQPKSQRVPLTFSLLASEDIDKSHALIMQNIDRLAPHLPVDPEQRAQKIHELDDNVKQALTDNKPVSKSSYKDGSFQRLTLKSPLAISTRLFDVAGIIDFFIREDNTGYIETVCTDEKHTHYTETLIKSALSHLKNQNVPLVTTHIGIHDQEYIELHETMGFKQKDQNEIEKQHNVIRFEYTFTPQ